jgi:MFS family permease
MAEATMAGRIPANFRRVIMAAAGGNIIEWYDFYIFGSLATILSVKFFEKSHPVAALLSTIALFTAGFLVRPLGAFVFGWLGDKTGRKYTFIMTLVGMALGTGAIGLIPTFDQIGLAAAIILFCLRMLQGLCLGGSYGGAITYVAEHVPENRRGYYTGWLQTSPTLGIVLSLIVIIVTRSWAGEAAFNDWAWRIPFLCSFLLIIVTMYMRRNFEESPVYAEIKAKGHTSKNPWREAFLNPLNLKYVVIATIVVLGEGVVWYSSQFWALFYLQTVSKLDTADEFADRGYRARHRNADTRLLRLAVGPHRPQAGHTRRFPAGGAHLLSAVYLARGGLAPGQRQYANCDPHHRHSGQLCRDGVRADRRVPCRVLPRKNSLHLGIHALHDRQRLGWRVGAIHHHGGLHRNRKSRLCVDLPDRSSCGVPRALAVPDARDPPDEHLGIR